MTTSTQLLPAKNELVLVTGASTGMGAATARELARRGYHVLAGVRRETDANQIQADRIEPVILDITAPDDIESVAARVGQDSGSRRLRAVVNNAGIAVNAPVEVLPLAEWRRQFDVNLFGHIAVTQAVLPFLISSRGRIVNITSVGGKIAMPTHGAYAGAKFALEAVSDSLRRELAPLGVQVVIVEPGGVTTEMAGRGIATANQLAEGMTSDQHGRYDGLIGAITAQAASFTKTGVPADIAGRAIADTITTPNPRTRYTIGRDAAILVRVARIVTDRTLDAILRRNLAPHYAKR
ncbi:SDR family oxidoreductase [Subtercola boreus]|uniref:Dehydrogenase n=1 Tax=Subtercola boreus TaxID=120213 RepID=A0A3E0W5F8_9MICO|nr:SDR family oxidoreductase [Subtercola boreus]RFA17594.1 dehydrogenase [Subtercola boreus]RFA17677.1 dehydrogenase [Subtercola boreus]RFA24267.1 dehydrogenase [Subtercola boreus]